MAQVNGVSNKPALASTRRPHIAPAVPHMYDKKKDQRKTPQTNGSLNGNGGGKPSLSENGQNVSVRPAPLDSAAFPTSNGSAGTSPPLERLRCPAGLSLCSPLSKDSRTVVAAPNGHPKTNPFALPELVQMNGPVVPISNAANLNGPVHERSPPVDWQQPAERSLHYSQIPYDINGHHARLSNGSLVHHGLQHSTASFPIFHTGSVFLPSHAVRDGARNAVPPNGASVDGPSAVVGGSNGPLTPGSVHGSPSSRVPDDVHRGHFPVVNGHDPVPMPNGHSPMGANGPMAASHIIKQGPPHEADTLHYLRSCALMPHYSDCFLEVHFPEPHLYYGDHPECVRLKKVVMVPAHRFVLARSGVFRQAMEKKELGPGGVLVFHLGDKYMRSDVVCAAIRTMYGWSLGEEIPDSALGVRHARDDMMLTLSYMAVGHDLQLPWVFGYAMQRAINLLGWDTVDLALGFALHHLVLPRRSGGPFGLGELMYNVLGFIIVKFPHDFVLDVKVEDGELSRLPRDGTSPAGSFHTSATASSMPSGQRPSNPGLQNIRFGDLSEQNGHGPVGHAAAPGPALRRAPTGVDTVLSQILLNLPYEMLKDVLEAPNLGGGGRSDLAKHLPVAELIAEREARRMGALSRAGPELLSALEKAAAPPVVNGQHDSYVSALGYKEEVCFGDGPFLLHTWTRSLPGSDAA